VFTARISRHAGGKVSTHIEVILEARKSVEKRFSMKTRALISSLPPPGHMVIFSINLTGSRWSCSRSHTIRAIADTVVQRPTLRSETTPGYTECATAEYRSKPRQSVDHHLRRATLQRDLTPRLGYYVALRRGQTSTPKNSRPRHGKNGRRWFS